jgi:hypothetical protein
MVQALSVQCFTKTLIEGIRRDGAKSSLPLTCTVLNARSGKERAGFFEPGLEIIGEATANDVVGTDKKRNFSYPDVVR